MLDLEGPAAVVGKEATGDRGQEDMASAAVTLATGDFLQVILQDIHQHMRSARPSAIRLVISSVTTAKRPVPRLQRRR